MLKDCVYQVITNDEYELPIAQEDTIIELARAIGKRPEHIARTIREGMTIDKKKYRIIKVELDEDDE